MSNLLITSTISNFDKVKNATFALCQRKSRNTTHSKFTHFIGDWVNSHLCVYAVCVGKLLTTICPMLIDDFFVVVAIFEGMQRNL